MKSEPTKLTASECEATRRRLHIWREAGPVLEEQRWNELMALTDAQALQMTRSMLGRPGVVPAPRETSGLVYQQALLQRSRRR